MTKTQTFVTADIECSTLDNGEFDYSLGVVYDGETYEVYYSIESLFIGLTDKTVYFHNLDFDIMFFIKSSHIVQDIEDCQIITSGSKIIGITLHTVEFRDSLALIPMPLKVIVSSYLGINDVDYFNDKSNVVNLNYTQLLSYCQKDCAYLFQALTKYWLGVSAYYTKTHPLTTPATALKVFLESFYEPSTDFLHISHRHKFFDDSYYFGGHTEVFEPERKIYRHTYYYDVNSLYPFASQELEFLSDKLMRLKPSKAVLGQLISNNHKFFCQVTVNIDRETLRFFPTLHQQRNRYFSGVHTYKMSEIGVQFILKYGSFDNIIEVQDILTTPTKRTITPFTKFINHFYDKRLEGGANKILYKLFLNSLYGKFAEKLTRRVSTLNESPQKTPPLSVTKLKSGVYLSQRLEIAPFYKKHLNRLDIAGKITEQSRLYMGGIINTIRLSGFNVWYTDTDSIMTDCCLETHHPHLIHSTKLGALKNELGAGKNDTVIIIGQKFYYLLRTHKSASKGVRNLTYADYKALVRDNSLTKTRQVFSKLSKYVSSEFFGIMEVPIFLQKFLRRND